MKKFLIYTLVGLCSLGASGSAVYFTRSLTNHSASVDASYVVDEDSSATVPDTPDTPETGISKAVNQILNAKEVKCPEIALTVKVPSYEDINLTITNLDLDIQDTSKIQAKGTLEVQYDAIDEKADIAYESTGYLYIAYREHHYAFDAPTTLKGVIEDLNIAGFEVPSFSSEVLSATFDLNALKEQGTKAIEEAAKTEAKTATGYSYEINFGSLTISSVIINGIDVTLTTDNDYRLTGISTLPGKVIDFAGKASLSGNATVELSDSSTYSSLSEEEKGTYQDLTHATSSILSTAAKIYGAKKLDCDIDVKLSSLSSKFALQEITGTMKADCSAVKEDFTKGKYEVTLKHSSSGSDLNSAYVYYENNSTYVKVNDLIKGKMSDTTLKDLFTIVSDEAQNAGYQDISDEANSVLSGTDFDKLRKGDLSVYQNFLKSFTYGDDGFTIVLNANCFGLGDYDLTVKAVYDADGNFQSIEIENLQYQDYSVYLSLTPKDFSGFTATDFTQYKDYAGLVPLFKTLSSLYDAKQFSTSYTMNLTTAAKEVYQIGGDISGDLTKFSVNKDDPTNDDYGNYHLSVKTALNGYDHALDLVYQENSLYFQYDDVFKNSITKTEVGKMIDVVKAKTPADSQTFSEMNDTISALKNSEKLKNDLNTLKNGSLIPLESFVTIDKDNLNPNKLILAVNVPYILEGTPLVDKVKGVTVTLDTDEKALTDIQVTGLSYEDNSLDFSLTLQAYQDFSLKDEQKLTYSPITAGSQLLSAFYALPTDLTKFNLGVDGSLVDSDGTKMTLQGGAIVDRSEEKKPKADGTVTLTLDAGKDTQNSHKVEFSYETLDTVNASAKTDGTLDGQIIAEYNDHMHIVLHNNTISDILNQVDTMKTKAADGTQANLLTRYTSALSDTTTAMPLMQAVKSKDYTMLLNDYVKKAVINDTSIVLTVSPKLFDAKDTSDNLDVLTVNYTNGDDPHITSANVKAVYSGKTIDVTLALGAYDATGSYAPSMTAYDDTTKSQFVDFDNFKLLTKCLIKTTESDYFDLSADFTLKLKLAGFHWTLGDLSTHATAHIKVVDEHTDAHLIFNNGNLSSTDSSYHVTEFFIDEAQVYVCQTKYSSGKLVSENFRMTRDEILKNAVYYIVDYILDINSLTVLGMKAGSAAEGSIFASVNGSSSTTTTVSKDYSRYVSSAIYYSDQKKFSLDVALPNIVSGDGLTFQDALVDVYHDDNGELTSFTMKGAGSNDLLLNYNTFIDVGVSLTATHNIGAAEDMTRYDAYVKAFKENASTSPLGEYQIKSITPYAASGLLGLFTDYGGVTVVDNGQKKSFTQGSADSVFFYVA